MRPDTVRSMAQLTDTTFWRSMWSRDYELKDHLGNVRVIVSDLKLNSGSIASPVFKAEVASYYNYYAYGSLQPHRSFASNSYRWGFNGQERADDVAGAANHMHAEFWEYDTRTGRRWDADPIVYAGLSPYFTFFGNPIRFSDTRGLEGEDEVAPAGHAEHRSANGTPLYLPANAKVETQSGGVTTLANNVNTTVRVADQSVKAFVIGSGRQQQRFVATYEIRTGKLIGYKNYVTGKYYENPRGLRNDGRVNQASWGETQGLYPTRDGAAVRNLYNPENWDYQRSQQLLRARAAIAVVATRNSHLRTDLPDDRIEQGMSVWHMNENLPAADAVIRNDATVQYFYLSPDPNARHTGLNYSTNDIRIVASYGPFYNVGGGDVPRGATYLIFYSSRPKAR